MSQIIENILRREAGYVDHPADRGGPTSWGITQRTLAEVRGRPVSADEVRALTRAEAAEILLERYVVAPQLDLVQDRALRELLIDCAVNHGPGRAVRWLQAAVGASADGVIGGKTIMALSEHRASDVWRQVLAQRLRFYGQMIRDSPTQAVFAAGWMARAAEFVEMP